MSSNIQKPVRVAFFDAKNFDRSSFTTTLEQRGLKDYFEFVFIQPSLTARSVELARGCRAVCCFVNDDLSGENLASLARMNIELVLMRCVGFDRVDLNAAENLGLPVCRVPAYSPNAVAEYAVTLLMALNRKIHTAYNRVRNSDFSIDGLVGFDLHGKTIGVVGTGKIGFCFAKIMLGFGCRILAYDTVINRELEKFSGVNYVSLPELLSQADVISLHAPLVPATHHMINAETLKLVKSNALLLNTSRGGLIDAKALIDALVSGRLGGAGLDVYENESKYFFRDFSDQEHDDEVLARLQSMRTVIITSHQAFLTQEALENISSCTIESLTEFYVENKPGPQLTNLVPVAASFPYPNNKVIPHPRRFSASSSVGKYDETKCSSKIEAQA